MTQPRHVHRNRINPHSAEGVFRQGPDEEIEDDPILLPKFWRDFVTLGVIALCNIRPAIG